MSRKDDRAAALKAAQDIADLALKEKRGLTDEEQATVEAKLAEVDGLDADIAREEKDGQLLAKLGGLAPKTEEKKSGQAPSKTLGEHFVKSVGAQIGDLKSRSGFTVAAPEFKAATDPQTTPGVFTQPVLEQVDTTLVRGYRRPLVTDLFGTGTISGTSIRYFVEGGVEGGFSSVAEAGQKPQLHIGDPTSVVDSVKKLAAWFDTADEMVEDLPFWASEINNRGLYLLSVIEEQQILSGDGSGSNLLGVLNRSGLGTYSYATGALADGIYAAVTQIQNVTGLAADGLVINPADYQTLRLAKDGNQQYVAGGPFYGQYGNGGLSWQPPVWGLSTVVSPAVAAGAPVVGAFKQAATVYRKGGVTVTATNSDQGKFTKDITTTRIEERLALAVRYPAAIVKLTAQSAG